MDWYYSLYIAVVILSVAINAALSIYSWQYRAVPGSTGFFWMVTTGAGWMLFSALELLVWDPTLKMLCNTIRYSFALFVSFVTVVFVLQFTGRTAWLRPHRLLLLALIPIIGLLLTWTNPLHHLIWTGYPLQHVGMLRIPIRQYGAWYTVQTTYNQVMILIELSLLTHAMITWRPPYRIQASILLLANICVIVADLIWVLDLVPGLALYPVSIVLHSLLTAWALFRYQLLDLVPVAHRALVQSMHDSLIVLDARHRVIELNPAAQHFIGLPAAAIIGQPVAHVMPDGEVWSAYLQDEAVAYGEITRQHEGIQHFYEAQIAPLRSRRGTLTGRMIVLRDITGRKRAEEALRQSEADLARAQEVASLGSFRYKLLTDEVIWSRQLCRLTGLGDEERRMTLADVARVFHPDDLPAVQQALSQVLSGQGSAALDLRILHTDGSVRHCHNQFEAVYDEHGRAIEIFGTAQDITTRKLAEEALRKSEEQYRLLTENMQDVVWVLDYEGHFTYVSPSVYHLRGYTAEEVLQQTAAEALTPASLQAVQVSIQAAEQRGSYRVERMELEQPCKDGTTVWTECVTVPLNDKAGQLTGWLGVSRNISERRRAEEALRKLSRAVEQSPVSVVITDTAGCIEYVNPWFTRVTGYTFEEACGQNPRVLKSGRMPPEIYTELWQTILSGNVWHGEFHNRKKNGELFWEVATISSITNSDGVVTHFVAIKEDITAQKLAATELQRAKEAAEAANRAKSTFLASMSHELRTPLNAILGFAQLLAEEPDMLPEHQEYLQIIERSGQHLLELINDVLELSKIEAGRVTIFEQDFNLHHLLEDVVDMFRLQVSSKRIQLLLEIESTVPQGIVADQGKLRQVLINLLSNAIKFTHEGGVALRTGADPLTQSDVSADQASTGLADEAPSEDRILLYFEIEDSGMGIAPEDLERIFDFFAQTTSGKQVQEGTGLGLPISQHFVHLMGGELQVASAAGRGSIFSFAIPVRLAPSISSPLRLSTRRVVGLEAGQPVYRILIVDDKAESRSLLTSILRTIGFDVYEAVNGREAVDIWSDREPHLVFMDMRMPLMDGYEATRHIKATTRGQATVVIALTASAFEEDRVDILMAGADDFIRKPFRLAELYDALMKHLRVRFVYEEQAAPADQARLPATAPVLTREAIMGLPAEWVGQLYYAATLGDSRQLVHLIEQIRTQHPALAEDLLQLVADFRFDTITAVTERATQPPISRQLP